MADTPLNPLAGPPGPGPFTTRPDLLTMGSTAYGEGIQTDAILRGAELSKTPDVKGMPASQVRNAASAAPVTPLYAPSQRPEEPITSGIPMGAGPGPEVLGMNAPVQDTDTDRQRLLSYLPALEAIAQSPGSSQSFRNYVRVLRASLL